METSPKKHLVIVDGHHLLYRAYWAIPRSMKTSTSEQVNTAFGVASMLLMILKTEQPSHVLFCFDADEDTFRHKEYTEYKAGRSATPDDFYSQVPRALELIDTFGIRSVSGGGFEADDFACSYARLAEKEGYNVTVVSGDRDLLQLCSSSIRISIPHKGYNLPEYLGPEEVLKKYGVTPEQIPSFKGLMGDSSDNLPGVKGIGPKAAAELLQTYSNISTLYDNLPKIKESWRTKLEADKEQAFFCERMATLIADIAPPVSLGDLAVERIDTTPILKLFSDLEFSLVTKRFMTLLDSPYGRAHFIFDHTSYAEEMMKNTPTTRRLAGSSSVSEEQEQAQMTLL